MMRYLFVVFYILINTCLLFSSGNAREVKYIYLNNNHYEFIDYLINAGERIPSFVFFQPYQLYDIFYSQPDSSLSYSYFDTYWQNYYGKKNVALQLLLSDRMIYSSDFLNRFKITWGGHFITPLVTLGNHTVVDQDYKHDPEFAGDLSKADSWIYGRVNDAYININFKGIDIFLGKINRNWGPINSTSLILSNNPYSYDHFLFSYTYNKIKISVLFGQLEELSALNSAYPDSIFHNTRKFLVGHRMDIGFSDKFQLALTEMATYGGPERDIELAFLNPMNFYYNIQRNDNRQMNGLWSLDIFYKPVPKLTFYGQFLLDDIIINNDPDVNDRDKYPDRLGTMFSVRTGNLIKGLNSDITYIRIWNRTYQSKYTWENYHYRGLSMGYPCASCEEYKIKLSYWEFFPWFFRNDAIIGKYGSVTLRDLFPLIKENFPVGPVNHNFINTFSLYYFYNANFIFYTSIKYTKNKEHYINRIDKNKGWFFSLGVNLVLLKDL